MISFFICLALLIIGYFTYGKFVEQTMAPDDRETPAVAINDGVDYVVLPEWKLFMIQLLNIAGLGPIFGAMTGALWGPIVLLWITFGTIFAGGVHDYMSGMLSERNNGASISEVTGTYLGPVMKNIMRVFSVILLVMVGTVFAVGPAGLLVQLFTGKGVSGVVVSATFWLAIIIIYYFIATFLSIDKIIGKLYPIFGACLIIMAVGVAIGTIAQSGSHPIPEIWSHFYNMHPSQTPVWSFMFITVACGAISGFHSTQSPLMARCMKSEKQGHFVFYGAMTAEGIIALVWATAGCSLYEVTGGLNTGLADILANGQAAAIYDVCIKTMGPVGVVLAMLGVVACPITSGDTAFRSARLTLADWMGYDQDKYSHRLALAIPVLGVGAILGFGNTFGVIDYTVIWRYFSWSNQTLAMIVLWAGAMYLAMNKRNYWVCAIPAIFMSAVSATYFTMAPECLGLIKGLTLNTTVAYPVGIIVAILFFAIFMHASKKYRNGTAAAPAA
ncbi:MAG: carbon starvation protein A [Anaerovoracaceae bacterium]